MNKSKFQEHRHNWQKTERRVKWHLFKLFVCVEHEKPVFQAYDVINTVAGMK